MKLLGIKVTHDGALALIDEGKLVFSYEMEKLNNNPRYSSFLLDLLEIEKILNEYNCNMDKIDKIVIDGWSKQTLESEEPFSQEIDLGKGEFLLDLAEYGRLITNEIILEVKNFNIDAMGIEYNSYLHVSSHVLGAYCTSPFSKRKEDAFVLAWDGGMVPNMFYFKYELNEIENCGYLFPVVGFIYNKFATKFDPFNKNSSFDLSISGKFMAYIALGETKQKLLKKFQSIYLNLLHSLGNLPMNSGLTDIISTNLINQFIDYGKSGGYGDVDIMATFNTFLQELLLNSLEKFMKNHAHYQKNLCFCGGSALNIKWNSALRASGLFKEIWVPPFTSDSGSAIGTACCEMVKQNGINCLDWDVYKGPPIINNPPPSSWKRKKCSLKQLAKLLHETSEPVVFLTGRAELGPRALGNRSILAPATSKKMKDKLNVIKNRENYRPVAPICLEEEAKEVFNPGISDPYMLFDHKLRGDWKDKVPAVIHLDGTSRLQTINKNQNQKIYKLLIEYKKISGIPLLCNTSANYKGKGFFPDVQSAVAWGKVNFVWSDYILYMR